MSMFHSINTTASALTSQRLRMDVISSNMANAETTRSEYVNGKWQPYQRKAVVLQSKESGSFRIFYKNQWDNPLEKVTECKSQK